MSPAARIFLEHRNHPKQCAAPIDSLENGVAAASCFFLPARLNIVSILHGFVRQGVFRKSTLRPPKFGTRLSRLVNTGIEVSTLCTSVSRRLRPASSKSLVLLSSGRSGRTTLKWEAEDWQVVRERWRCRRGHLWEDMFQHRNRLGDDVFVSKSVVASSTVSRIFESAFCFGRMNSSVLRTSNSVVTFPCDGLPRGAIVFWLSHAVYHT